MLCTKRCRTRPFLAGGAHSFNYRALLFFWWVASLKKVTDCPPRACSRAMSHHTTAAASHKYPRRSHVICKAIAINFSTGRTAAPVRNGRAAVGNCIPTQRRYQNEQGQHTEHNDLKKTNNNELSFHGQPCQLGCRPHQKTRNAPAILFASLQAHHQSQAIINSGNKSALTKTQKSFGSFISPTMKMSGPSAGTAPAPFFVANTKTRRIKDWFVDIVSVSFVSCYARPPHRYNGAFLSFFHVATKNIQISSSLLNFQFPFTEKCAI